MRLLRRQTTRTLSDASLARSRTATRREIARRLLRGVLGCALAIAVMSEAEGQDEWTRFRGPDGTGVSDTQSIPATFTEADYRWNVKLPGNGHSSPVLWGERIFLTCQIEDDNRRFVVCLDADDGQLLWKYDATYEPYKSHTLNSFASSTPTVDADRVYVSWVSGRTFIVLALDHDGNRLWQREMGDFLAKFGPGASPIVMDGIVIMGNDNASDVAFIIGLDAETGETRWKLPRKSGLASYITPAVYRPTSGPVELIFLSQSNGVTGVDPKTGKVNWEWDGQFTLKSVASPVIAGELIMTSAGKGGGGVESAIVRRGDGPSGRQPELAYRLTSDYPYVPTPILFGSHLFVWSDSGVVTCIEPATGTTVWQEETGTQFFASPICVDGRLYNVSKQGEVIVMNASVEYKLLARNQLPDESFATPAVALGSIFFRTFDHLIRIGPEEK